jgi:hypothetical protein
MGIEAHLGGMDPGILGVARGSKEGHRRAGRYGAGPGPGRRKPGCETIKGIDEGKKKERLEKRKDVFSGSPIENIGGSGEDGTDNQGAVHRVRQERDGNGIG